VAMPWIAETESNGNSHFWKRNKREETERGNVRV
jgi:hypothetical protein